MSTVAGVIDVADLVMRFEATRGRFSMRQVAQEFAPLVHGPNYLGPVTGVEAAAFCKGFRAGQAWAGYGELK